MIKTSSDQFGGYPLVKMILFFDIFTPSPTSNLGPLSLILTLWSIYVVEFTWIGFK